MFGSRVRDRVFWFGIEMNTMVMVLNLIEEQRWIKKEKGMKNSLFEFDSLFVVFVFVSCMGFENCAFLMGVKL